MSWSRWCVSYWTGKWRWQFLEEMDNSFGEVVDTGFRKTWILNLHADTFKVQVVRQVTPPCWTPMDTCVTRESPSARGGRSSSVLSAQTAAAVTTVGPGEAKRRGTRALLMAGQEHSLILDAFLTQGIPGKSMCPMNRGSVCSSLPHSLAHVKTPTLPSGSMQKKRNRKCSLEFCLCSALTV